jgi:uncharacterized delta-60 repeat protein
LALSGLGYIETLQKRFYKYLDDRHLQDVEQEVVFMKKASQLKAQSPFRFVWSFLVLSLIFFLGACSQSKLSQDKPEWSLELHPNYTFNDAETIDADLSPEEAGLSPLAAGDLDTTFSGDGLVDSSLQAGSDRARGLAVQSDGKVVLAGTTGSGNYGVLRYKADGSGLDLSFDGDGIKVVDMGSATDTGTAMTLQSDGKIVVVGEVAGGFGKDVGVMRLNSNGSLDNTFSGDGKGFYDFNHYKDDYVTGVVMQGTKIVVSGWVQEDSSSSNTVFVVMRLNSDGSPDLSFNGSGVKRFSFSPEGALSAKAYGLTIANNKVIVVGRAEFNANIWYMAAARLNDNGSLDNSFSGNGLAVLNFKEVAGTCSVGSENEAFGVAINPGLLLVGTDPGFVMVGRTNACGDSDVAVARLLSNGNLDTSFSLDGKRILGDANIESARAVRNSGGLPMPGPSITPKKITIAGYREGGVGGSDFQVMRLNWDGSSDNTFSVDGKLTTDFNGSHDRGYALVLAGGKIYVAGETKNGADYEFAVAGYNAN